MSLVRCQRQAVLHVGSLARLRMDHDRGILHYLSNQTAISRVIGFRQTAHDRVGCQRTYQRHFAQIAGQAIAEWYLGHIAVSEKSSTLLRVTTNCCPGFRRTLLPPAELPRLQSERHASCTSQYHLRTAAQAQGLLLLDSATVSASPAITAGSTVSTARAGCCIAATCIIAAIASACTSSSISPCAAGSAEAASTPDIAGEQ